MSQRCSTGCLKKIRDSGIVLIIQLRRFGESPGLPECRTGANAGFTRVWHKGTSVVQ
jgi:hypothetical protein